MGRADTLLSLSLYAGAITPQAPQASSLKPLNPQARQASSLIRQAQGFKKCTRQLRPLDLAVNA